MKPVEVEILISGNFKDALANGRLRARMLGSSLDSLKAKGADMGSGIRQRWPASLPQVLSKRSSPQGLR